MKTAEVSGMVGVHFWFAPTDGQPNDSAILQVVPRRDPTQRRIKDVRGKSEMV
jgi:hypothetical protein